MTGPTARDSALGDADVGRLAVLLGEPHRLMMLLVMADGGAHPASALAGAVGLKPSAATAHLQRLAEGGLIHVERAGRFRLHSLAGPDVARLVEALAAVAPPRRVSSLGEHSRSAALRAGRSCYDHLAGALGVAVADALRAHNAVRFDDPTPDAAAGGSSAQVVLGPAAGPVFGALGVGLDAAVGRRPALRLCLDWSERRYHLSGALGAALLDSWLRQHWITRRRGRSVRLTPRGVRQLESALPGVKLPTA